MSMQGKNKNKRHSESSKQNMRDGGKKFKEQGKTRKSFSSQTYENMKKAQNDPVVRAKIAETKRINGTFNSSKTQQMLEQYLKAKFGVNDVEVEYNKDARYPFRCDFYIKSLDLFIEYNGFGTHNNHLYDNTSVQDLIQARRWKRGTKFEQNAFDNGTRRDVIKYEYINKLNHIGEYDANVIIEKLEEI